MNSKTPTILVVDDEPDLELLITQKFRKEIKEGKYCFEFAGNGVQALKKLFENQDIELVLTDINMPEMDGLTLLSKIKELNNPVLHSVIVSAYGDLQNIRTAMNGGAFDFVVKPINFTDLEITINKALTNLDTFKKALKSRDELITVRKELDEARALQLSMLPELIPHSSELDFAVYMKTASEVGGDYYDFSRKTDGSLNISIGDATGHGMRAGIMVAVMKTLFITNSTHHDLEDFFKLANKAIKSLNLGRIMMAFTILNIKNNRVQFINAGMPPIFLYQKENNKIIEYENHFMPIGAMSNSTFQLTEFEVSSGDAILMLSDGLPELSNSKKEYFGYEKVQSEFLKVAEDSPEEIIGHLKFRALEWTGNVDPVDDVTFIVFKIK
ncbi:MAG: SpoIIE family protein phosphatase [Melioribacteraceae bacterium]|nr:SpoIIE family protein phosphatase [Melioribacteraceae bacterium]